MARPTIANLRSMPYPGHSDPYSVWTYIESFHSSLVEDAKRLEECTRTLEYEADNPTKKDAQLSPDLRQLDRMWRPGRLSQASAMQMRDWRATAIPNVWRLVDESGVDDCFTFTAILPSWIRTSDEFEQIPAGRYTEQFRSLLNRNSAGRTAGWLLAKLDCEFDLRNRLYRPHLHGVVYGDMVGVLDSLRQSKLLRPQLTPMIEGRRVARPLQIDRRPLTNLPMPLSYVLKSHFSARWLGYGSDGKVKRGRHPCRIPEPYGTRTLLWLDRQKLSDMFVMFGLAIRHGQLVPRT